MDIDLNLTPEGKPKVLKDRSYRFDINFLCDGVIQMVVKGFRIPVSMIKILPPSTVSSRGVYSIVEIESEFETKIKRIVQECIKESNTTVGAANRN